METRIDPRTSRPRILLVEDERAVREMLSRVLTRQGYELIVASTGDQAVALCDEDVAALDLVISDIVMPGASGPDVAAHLLARAPHLEVLFMSGYADHPLFKRVVNAGSRFIGKPFSLAHFRAIVKEALTSNRRAARRSRNRNDAQSQANFAS